MRHVPIVGVRFIFWYIYTHMFLFNNGFLTISTYHISYTVLTTELLKLNLFLANCVDDTKIEVYDSVILIQSIYRLKLVQPHSGLFHKYRYNKYIVVCSCVS